MSVDRSEKNRRLALWLGWKWDQDLHYWHHPECKGPPEGHKDCGHTYLDFFTSEEASALVLEAMPWADLSKQDPTSEWRCDPLGGAEGPNGNGMSVYDPDRKTAIAEAFIKWREG